MIKLFWCPNTRAFRIFWMLEELGIDYEPVLVDIREEDRAPVPGFAEASPMGKVPALEDGAVSMAESAAICLYLADRYSGGDLAPAIDDPDRGRFLYWLFFTPAVIEPAMSEKFAGAATNRVSNAWGDYDSMIATFESGLADGPWILGERFTAADVMMGSSAVFMRLFGLPVSDPLGAYADRCLARPAYERATRASEQG
ncbi:MAG: glutathione S-transferase [Thermoanaerobaculia bacterium]|nr:glutathione S-transferase [Thermoanaerobaculia bacterium]